MFKVKCNSPVTLLALNLEVATQAVGMMVFNYGLWLKVQLVSSFDHSKRKLRVLTLQESLVKSMEVFHDAAPIQDIEGGKEVNRDWHLGVSNLDFFVNESLQ